MGNHPPKASHPIGAKIGDIETGSLAEFLAQGLGTARWAGGRARETGGRQHRTPSPTRTCRRVMPRWGRPRSKRGSSVRKAATLNNGSTRRRAHQKTCRPRC